VTVTDSFAPLLLTIDQAAQALAISRSSIYELVLRGDIESIKIGRCRRITPAALQQYIESLTEQDDAPQQF
jgi:excisionase family DNA binding protein